MRAVPQFFDRRRGRPRRQNQLTQKHHRPPVGAGLLAKGPAHSTLMST